MDPFEDARRIEAEIVEARRRLDEEDRRMVEESRRIDEAMRAARRRANPGAPEPPPEA